MTKQDVIENVKDHVNGDRQDVLINYYNEQPEEFFLNYEESNLAQDMTRDLKRVDAIREHSTDVLDTTLKKQIEVIKNSAFADEGNHSEEYISILRRARAYVLDSLYNYYIDCKYECVDIKNAKKSRIRKIAASVKFTPSIIAYFTDYITRAYDLECLLSHLRCYCYDTDLDNKYVLCKMSIKQFVTGMVNFLLQMYFMGNFSFERKYRIVEMFYGAYKTKIRYSQFDTYSKMPGSLYIKTGEYDSAKKTIEVYIPHDFDMENTDSWIHADGEIPMDAFNEALSNEALGSCFPEYICLEG